MTKAQPPWSFLLKLAEQLHFNFVVGFVFYPWSDGIGWICVAPITKPTGTA